MNARADLEAAQREAAAADRALKQNEKNVLRMESKIEHHTKPSAKSCEASIRMSTLSTRSPRYMPKARASQIRAGPKNIYRIRIFDITNFCRALKST